MRKAKKQASHAGRPPAGRAGQSGITLFEILISMVIFVGIVVLANQALFSALRGSSKSQLTTRLKQSAEYAFTVMERGLRPAVNITTCSATSIVYVDSSGKAKSFTCNNVGTAGYLSDSTSRITSDDVAVTACSFVCTTSGPVRTVSLDMTLSQPGASVNLKVEEQGSYRLKSQVYLRN